MNFIIDTHIFLYLFNGDKILDENLIKDIEKPASKIYVSVASLWEISIKVNIGKLSITRNLDEMIERLDIIILNIQQNYLKTYLELPLIHRDPFDRLIIAQAITDNLTLITDDQAIKNYPNLKLF